MPKLDPILSRSDSSKWNSPLGKEPISKNSQLIIHTLEWMNKQTHSFSVDADQSNDFEILWIKSGIGKLNVNLKEHEVHAGMILLLRPGLKRTLNHNNSLQGYYLSLSSDFKNIIHLESNFLFLSPQYANNCSPLTLHMDKGLSKGMETVLTRMELEFNSSLFQRSELLNTYFKLFLIFLAQTQPTQLPSFQHSRNSRITNKFIALVNANFKKEKKVNFYAHELCVTPSYLNHLVKEVSGITASTHIYNQIVNDAKYQARNIHRSMKEIAFDLGFDDTAHFSKFFKNFTGANFSVFRKELSQRP